jgi:glycosyltransferase involved in cell wall biosynthesis
MKIVFFYRDLLSTGGMPREIRIFMGTLEKQGHRVRGIGFDSAKSIPADEIGSSAVFRSPRFLLTLSRRTKDFLRSLKDCGCIDFMVIIGGHIISNYPVCRWCHRENIPFIFSPGAAYSPVLLKRRKRILKLAWRPFELRILRWASIIRAYSFPHIGQIRRFCHLEKYIIVREGVDREIIPRNVAPLDFPKGITNVLFLGRIDLWGKGIEEIIGSVRIIDAKGYPILLHLVGPESPTEGSRLRIILQTLPQGAYRVYGPVYGPERFGYYKGADLFIYPSRHEGIPRSVREALAMGLPVVVTPETNMADEVSESGAGFRTGCSAAEIAEAIERFIRLPPEEKLAMKSRAEELAGAAYEWPAICDRFVAEVQRRGIVRS